MNKVIIIHLNGIAYQLEEDGYEALRAYLDSASRRLEGNPDRDEIIADIEHSIADKFRGVLGANKTVVMTREVQDVIAEMGPVQDDSPAGAAPGGARAAGPAAAVPPPPAAGGGSAPKRLFRIREGAKIGGVCNGIAAYFGADVTLVRVLFAIVGITFGAGILIYIALMVIVPWAETPADIAAAYGDPSTTDEIIRRAKEGYYSGIRAFRDPANRRQWKQWKRQFRQDMRQHRRDLRDTMRRNIHDWRQNWDHRWHPDHPAHSGWWFAYPIFGVLSALVSLLCVASIFSLVLTGSVFGILLPFAFPFWMQIVLLILFFRLISWPLKAMRYGYYSPGPYYPHPFAHFLHTVVWFGVLVFGLWLLDRHSPQAHQVLSQVRHEFHEFLAQVRDWWARQ